jgi:aryl-alcohol dehydrogenase-like predicted oxidoreductase
MLKRKLGRTGLEVTVLSFGCGAVGGLMTKGQPADQTRAVAWAIERGMTYFDTAAQYGDGTSEVNLGRVLRELKPKVAVGTKVRLPFADYGRIAAAIGSALEASLKRLQLESLDLYQLHNRAAAKSEDDALDAGAFLSEVVPAFEKLRQQGKIRHFGITALGETPALTRIVESGAFDTAQVCFNALNSSAAAPFPTKDYPGQDYDRLLQRAKTTNMGTIGIRILAGGALAGTEARHPLNVQVVEPIGSGADFRRDVERARRLEPMIREGHVSSLPELATRFVISEPTLSTALIGQANQEQLEAAVTAAEKGPLSAAALKRLAELQAGFAGESR